MDALDLARWQFAVTTVYHFLFVPITIGLSAVTGWYHVGWVRSRNEDSLRLAKFFGKLFTINFALGLVTGIVQEFQFGMNWSAYSRFVGDIFGAPLAFEALLAFFLESTFLGLWIFGWGKLPERLHASLMWIVHIGTLLSAYFILAANSFMQHPVGYRFNPRTGRAEMSDFIAVLTNKVQLITFPHVIFSSYMVGGGVVLGVSLYLLRKHADGADRGMYRRAVKNGAVLALVASVLVCVTGDVQGKIMTEVQPMKMAAAEALYDTSQPASFSVFTIGSLNGDQEIFSVRIPHLLSFLATGDVNGKVEGINQLRPQERALAQQVTDRYGPEVGALVYDRTYTPYIPLTYWSFRLMMGMGFLLMAFSVVVLWALRRGGVPRSRGWTWVAVLAPIAPVLAMSFGWIFTETGRQPWIVYGLMTTHAGVSTSVSGATVATSLIVYTLLYAVLMVVEVRLFLTYVRRGAEPFSPPVGPSDVDDDAPLQFAY